MNAQKFLREDSEFVLDTIYLRNLRMELTSTQTPRSINPWPFLAVAALALFFFSLNNLRKTEQRDLQPGALTQFAAQSYPRGDLFVNHNVEGTYVPENRGDKKP